MLSSFFRLVIVLLFVFLVLDLLFTEFSFLNSFHFCFHLLFFPVCLSVLDQISSFPVYFYSLRYRYVFFVKLSAILFVLFLHIFISYFRVFLFFVPFHFPTQCSTLAISLSISTLQVFYSIFIPFWNISCRFITFLRMHSFLSFNVLYALLLQDGYEQGSPEITFSLLSVNCRSFLENIVACFPITLSKVWNRAISFT